MKLHEILVTKLQLESFLPADIVSEITSKYKLKNKTSKISFNLLQPFLWEQQQARLLKNLGFSLEATLIDQFFGPCTFAGFLLPHVAGAHIKSVDTLVSEIFNTKSLDVDVYFG